jgi:hypothetical protein
MVWGIAAIDAYKAYDDSTMLQIAQDGWNSSVQWQITEAQARAGKIPGKKYEFESTCAGSMSLPYRVASSLCNA